MMSPEQRKIVTEVYNHLLESEKRGWDGLDDYINQLEFLSNDQLHREADVVYTYHENEVVRCSQDHAQEKCFIPVLVDAVAAILTLYKDKGNMHEKNKYILQYYLAMNQAGLILIA
jgi:hypothetical protein